MNCIVMKYFKTIIKQGLKGSRKQWYEGVVCGFVSKMLIRVFIFITNVTNLKHFRRMKRFKMRLEFASRCGDVSKGKTKSTRIKLVKHISMNIQ